MSIYKKYLFKLLKHFLCRLHQSQQSPVSELLPELRPTPIPIASTWRWTCPAASCAERSSGLASTRPGTRAFTSWVISGKRSWETCRFKSHSSVQSARSLEKTFQVQFAFFHLQKMDLKENGNTFKPLNEITLGQFNFENNRLFFFVMLSNRVLLNMITKIHKTITVVILSS